jgi:hypothetical protein
VHPSSLAIHWDDIGGITFRPLKPLAFAAPAVVVIDRRWLFVAKQNMSTNIIIKASVSLVALATSAASLFVISWIGLALLGY